MNKTTLNSQKEKHSMLSLRRATVITTLATSRRTEQRMATAQAVTDTKLEELTREVRAHNNFAQRVPVLEEQMRVANHRITDLENKTA